VSEEKDYWTEVEAIILLIYCDGETIQSCFFEGSSAERVVVPRIGESIQVDGAYFRIKNLDYKYQTGLGQCVKSVTIAVDVDKS